MSIKKRKTTKKQTRKKYTKKNLNTKKLTKFIIIIFLFAFITSVSSYFILTKEKNTNTNVIQNNILEKKPELVKNNFEEITKEFNIDYDIHPIKETKKEEIKIPVEKKEEKQKLLPKTIKKEETKEIQTPQNEKKIIKDIDKQKEEETLIPKLPKLAIIIDDITTTYQLKKTKEVGYPINLSFLPPTKEHPISARIAQDIPHHMIHLPLEASKNFTSQEKDVLNITDSYETIEKRIKELRKLYPKVKYTNNHTGSVFTQNKAAMNKLFKALKKYNFIFVDSRTTSKSVAKEMALKYNMPYIVRNIFIDNKKEYDYIQGQLKKAIKIAKKHNFAIAIGHPYSLTFKVLRESKHLLNGIELVYINQL